jgi:hypothetical protein
MNIEIPELLIKTEFNKTGCHFILYIYILKYIYFLDIRNISTNVDFVTIYNTIG